MPRINLFFKTPDVVDMALESENYTPEEQSEIKEFLSKYLVYGESITIQFDTDEKRATVLKNNHG